MEVDDQESKFERDIMWFMYSDSNPNMQNFLRRTMVLESRYTSAL